MFPPLMIKVKDCSSNLQSVLWKRFSFEAPVQILLIPPAVPNLQSKKCRRQSRAYIQENRMKDKVKFISTMMDFSTSTTLASARGDLSLIGFTKQPDLDWPWSLRGNLPWSLSLSRTLDEKLVKIFKITYEKFEQTVKDKLVLKEDQKSLKALILDWFTRTTFE